MTKRVLFLDDRSDRIHSALREYALPKYELTIVCTAKECIKMISNKPRWDIVSLDHDLNFEEFVDSEDDGCGMEVARWLVKNYNALAENQKLPNKIILHSSNEIAAKNMQHMLRPFFANIYCIAWKYPKYYNSIVAGAFDVIHPEYINLFRTAKQISSFLTVALHVVPEGKPKPVLSHLERQDILYSIRYVDHVIPYYTEDELTEILLDLNKDGRLVRVMGDDHKDRSTRDHLGIATFYKPYGEWSATKIKKLYGQSVK